MNTPQSWIQQLQLQPHPEGGFYRETYRSKLLLSTPDLPIGFTGPREISTAIYFLLPSGGRSLFHRIKSDEIWHFHAGSSLLIYTLSQKFGLQLHRIGLDLMHGDNPQVVIPANTWFGGFVEAPSSYSLCSCTVAPGFHFDDFELAQRNDLLQEFPEFKHIILQLTS